MTDLDSADRDEFPASFAQERLWFFHRFEPQSAVYHSTLAVRLHGSLDRPVLRQALAALVERHESLRTTFGRRDGELMQRVATRGDIPLAVVDLEAVPQNQRFGSAARLAIEEAKRPFDLDRGPVARATLYRLSPDDHIFYCVVHHITTDGWSMTILLDELAEIYGALIDGRTPRLPPLQLQYADFSVWQRESLQGDALDDLLQYWREQLAGAPTVLEIPGDRPRPPVLGSGAGVVEFTVPTGTREALATLARQAGATSFMTLLAAFAVLLRRYSGSTDVLIGTPVAGRTEPQLERVIGCFVNTLALRLRMDDDPTFRDLVERARCVVLDAIAHQDLPFERLVSDLQPERVLSHTPVVQVMFALQSVPLSTSRFGPLEVGSFTLEPTTTPFDLLVEMAELADGFGGRVSYRSDLFDEATVHRLVRNFVTLLDSAAHRSDDRVSRLTIVSPEERQLVLQRLSVSSSRMARDVPVHRLVEAVARRRPHALAVAANDGDLSYAELDARADRLARDLRARDVGRGSLVCVYAEPGAGAVTAMLAVLKAGAAYVPVDPDSPPARVAFVIEDVGAPVVLTHSHLAGGVPEGVARVLLDSAEDLDAVELAENVDYSTKERVDEALESTDGDDLAYAIYTSGSTGAPKAVLIRHRNLVNLVEWHHERFGVGPDDRMGQTARLGFDASVWEIWACLAGGASLHVADRATRVHAAALRDWILRRRLTQVQAATILAERLIELDWPADTALRTLSCGGEKLVRRPRTGSPFSFHDMYGPAECTVISLSNRVEPRPEPTGFLPPPPLGRPITNARVHILDDYLEPVPIGVVGEICIAGDGVGAGYLRRPALTADRFRPDPFSGDPGARLYRTGDLGRFLADGRIEMRGRSDHQVKIRGIRTEPAEVESVLNAHPNVVESAVVPMGEGANRRLVAHIISAPASVVDAAELRSHLRRFLPEHMVPAAFIAAKSLPVNANGKIDRAALARTHDGSERIPVGDLTPPRTPTEHTVAGVWRDTLPGEAFGITDKFFDVGGHSLALVEVYERLDLLFPGVIAVADLFEHTTIEAIAALVDARAGSQVLEPAGFEL